MAVTITQGTQTPIKSTTDGADEIQHVRNDGGTIGVISSIPNVKVDSGTQQTLGTVGTVAGVGVVSMLSAGTITTLPAVNMASGTLNVGTATVSGNVGVSTGTITTGSISNVAMVHAGTVNTVTSVSNLVTGTVAAVTSVTNVANLAKGTVTEVGSVTAIGAIHTAGTVNEVTLLKAGTVKLNATPAGSTIISTHVLGTGGGTFFGTLLAPAGAGTNVYVTGLSIVGRSGTVDCGLANNVAGTTGLGVLARGFFDPGGGIARDFNPAINIGANGTIAYFLVTAGTVDFTVNYWVSP